MTNDELLSKLLDNSLTELERRELDARMASSPHFAEEVREFLAVEELLVKTKPSLVSAPEHFIEAVGKRTATTIAAAATTATLTSEIGQSSLQQWIVPAIAALLFSTAALLYVAWPANTTEDHNAVPSAATTTAPSTGSASQPTNQPSAPLQEQQVLAQAREQRNTAPAVVVPKQPEHHRSTHTAATEPIAQRDMPKPKHTPEASPQDSSREFSLTKQADTPQEQELLRQIELYKSSQTMGNQVLQMSTAKKIGILYRGLQQYNNSRRYLEKAREIARLLHMEEEEAIAIGELGLLEKEQDNQLQALQLVQQCVQKLTEQHSPSLQRWQEELQALQHKK